MRESHYSTGPLPGGPPPLLAAVLSRDGRAFERADPAALPADWGSAAAMGVIEPGLEDLADDALARHRDGAKKNLLTIIVAPRDAPPDDHRNDGEVLSFLASPALIRRVPLAAHPLRKWCYELTRALLSGPRLDADIAVLHKRGGVAAAPPSSSAFDVVIPHRGLERHLRLSVDSIRRQDAATHIMVGLDQKAACAKFLRDVLNARHVDAFQLFPHPAGPYAVRHHLGKRGGADIIAWQDSDDVSLPHRLRLLAQAAKTQGAGIVGSHELRLHGIRHELWAVRYPLDASAAIAQFGPGHQVLFPTTMVERRLFEALGGMSTHLIFGLDMNFCLAASFRTRIINVDEFLYVRRRLADSLTLRPDIGMKTAPRIAVQEERLRDYAAVRAGRLKLEESALGIRHREGALEFKRLTPRRTSGPKPNPPAEALPVVISRDGAAFEAGDDLKEGAFAFGVVQPSLAALALLALKRHRAAPKGQSRLTLIIAPREAPLDDFRYDDDVYSFLASPDLMARAKLSALPVQRWCYAVLHAALAGTKLDIEIDVVHKLDMPVSPPAPAGDFDVIIPHRGLERHLRLSVDSILRQGVAARIDVALDQTAACATFLREVRGNPAVRVFQLFPHPVGHFVPRHHLGHSGSADIIAWQDSDDVALKHRLATLLAAAKAHDAGIVGSHAVRLDEVNERVYPMRRPLDANAALDRHGAANQVLLPTSIVRRDVFTAVGGFSTHLIFSLDVNFWLAASLHARVLNVDEFLYIHRWRPRSLTARPDTGLGSPARDALRALRARHYAAVRAREMRLEDSVLALTHRQGPVDFRRLR